MQWGAIRAQSKWSTLPAVATLPFQRNTTARRLSGSTLSHSIYGVELSPVVTLAGRRYLCRAFHSVIVSSASGSQRQRFNTARKPAQPSSNNSSEPSTRIADVSTSAVTSNGTTAISTVPKSKAPNAAPTPSLTKARPVPKKIRLTADEKELRLIQLETAADPMASQLASDLPTDIVDEFEKRLEADIETVFTTLVAITGVIVFWRGVWSVLDHFIGDSLFGDICCILVGLTIIFWIRLSGARLADFWPGA